jgi:hypothetical protein
MTPDRKLTDLDQQKRGLQDDHDPSDMGQKQADRRGGVRYKSGKKRRQGIVHDEARPRPAR